MTDKEFKRLSRAQLIDIIYQFQLKQDELVAENERLTKELADKRLHITNAGNIAEAAMGIHGVMQSAQEAAQLYLEEIRIMREETEEKCLRLLEKARQEADAIVIQAKTGRPAYESALETILEEFGPHNRSTGERK